MGPGPYVPPGPPMGPSPWEPWEPPRLPEVETLPEPDPSPFAPEIEPEEPTLAISGVSLRLLVFLAGQES